MGIAKIIFSSIKDCTKIKLTLPIKVMQKKKQSWDKSTSRKCLLGCLSSALWHMCPCQVSAVRGLHQGYAEVHEQQLPTHK